jgi:hypothetical protein
VRGGWALALLAALALFPSGLAAQGRGSGFFNGPLQAGPRVGRDFDNKAWSVGGQLAAPLGPNLELRPSGDLFFPSGEGMGWQLNGDAAIRFGEGAGLYAGGGVAFVHPDDSDTETGYNLFFGLSTAPPQQRTKGFLEFRWTFVNDTSPFHLALGFLYRL